VLNAKTTVTSGIITVGAWAGVGNAARISRRRVDIRCSVRSCDVCAECGCPRVDGFAHYAGCKAAVYEEVGS